MSDRAAGMRRALPAVALALGISSFAVAAAGQQPPAGGAQPTTEQLRQAIEEIKRRLQRPSEGQPPAEQTLAAELKAANQRIAELGDALSKLRAERDRLVGEAEAARGESQRLGQALAELEGRAQALEKRMAELSEDRSREVERLQGDLAQMRQRAEETAQAAAGKEQRVRELESELERLRGEMAAKDKALAEARSYNERTDFARRELEGELKALVSRLGELEDALARGRAQAREEAEAAARRLEELSGKLAAAEAERARLEGEAGELRAIAATSVGELQSLGEQLLRVLADNQALLQMLEQVRSARESAVAEAAAARRDAELYAAEANRLRSQLAGAATSAAAAQPAAAQPAAVQPAAAPPSPDGLAASEPAFEPLPRAQLVELRAVEAPDGTVVTMIEGTAFQFASEKFSEAANGALLRVGRLIDLVKPERIRLIGHTDSQGDEAANRRLSLRRAQAARDWLVRNRGLEPARIQVEGRGPDQPIATNDTPEGRRANRRVEVVLERRKVAR